MLDEVASTVSDPVDALFCPEPESPAWWEVSLDQGLTWHFLATDSATYEDVTQRLQTVLSGKWDHAMADDWMDEEQKETPPDPEDRAAAERADRERYEESIDDKLNRKPKVAFCSKNDTGHIPPSVIDLLGVYEQLLERLTTNEPMTQDFLQSIWDASGGSRSPFTEQTSSLVFDALTDVEEALRPYYDGFAWVGCDGPHIAKERLLFCTRQSYVILLAWLVTFATLSLKRSLNSDQSFRKQAQAVELSIHKILQLILDDDGQREWQQATQYLQRQLRKLSGSKHPVPQKLRTRVVKTASKFLKNCEAGFGKIHDRGYTYDHIEAKLRSNVEQL